MSGPKRSMFVSEERADSSTSRSRGRVRFIVPSDVSDTDLTESSSPPETQKSDKSDIIRKVDKKITRPLNKPYEVKELLDDIPNQSARKIHKPRVITETRFEAANAPKKPVLVPLPIPEDEVFPEDLLPNFSPQTTKTTTEKIKDSVTKDIPVVSENIPQSTQNGISIDEGLQSITTNPSLPLVLTTKVEQSSSTENEVKKIDTSTTAAKRKLLEQIQTVTPNSDVRKSSRTRPRTITTTEEQSTVRSRSRTRPENNQEISNSDTSATSGVVSRRRPRPESKKDEIETSRLSKTKTIRRRLDVAEIPEAGTRGWIPSVFSSDNAQEIPLRSRTGRKVNYSLTSENGNAVVGDRNINVKRRIVQNNEREITENVSDQDERTNKDIPRSPRRNMPLGRSNTFDRNTSNRNRERNLPLQISEIETITSPPSRRVWVGHSRKHNRNNNRLSRINEGTDVQNGTNISNESETINSRSSRGRSHFDKEEFLNEPTSKRTRNNKPIKQTENDVATTTISSRKLEYQSRNKLEPQLESKVVENLAIPTQRNVGRSRTDVRRNKTVQGSTSTPTPDITTFTYSRNDPRRRNSIKKIINVEPLTKEITTERETYRSRSRTRLLPPIIDEQILEVLPLFESEVKTVAPIKKKYNLSKENRIKISTGNDILTDLGNGIATNTVSTQSPKPIIKESVETKISEVVTKRKIGRQIVRKVKVNKSADGKIHGVKTNKLNLLQSSLRGSKRAEAKVKDNSEEGVEDSDNYPEPFKALIQAKQTKKGLRSHQTSNDDAVTQSSNTERIVTSTKVTPTVPTTSTTRINENVDDLVSSTLRNPRPTRRRFSLTTKQSETETVTPKYYKRPIYSTRKIIRSTVSPSQVSVVTEISAKVRQQPRYHARFSAAKKDERFIETDEQKLAEKDIEGTTSIPKKRDFSAKPYSNKNFISKRTNKVESTPATSKISTGVRKASRYSSRYRSDLFSRSGSTRPTNAPAYIPTVPTITTSSSVKSGVEDNLFGMEVISIDEPVNSIPSDNLINGELLTSSNLHNSPPSKLIPAPLVTKDGSSAGTILKSTEKPVSIIERIIYSITAISTASPDVTIDLTNNGPTKASAIFKIPSKTTPSSDVTFDELAQRQTVTNALETVPTTEKPTTVIERILSSISAIQASTAEPERTDTQADVIQNSVLPDTPTITYSPLVTTSATIEVLTTNNVQKSSLNGTDVTTSAMETLDRQPKARNISRDIEEVNIEENTISNNGNNKPEKIREQTKPTPTVVQEVPTTPMPISATSSTILTTTIVKGEGIVSPSTEVPETYTAPLAAIRIDDLENSEATTIIMEDTSVNVPFTTSPTEVSTERIAITTPRYTNTPTSIGPKFENLQLTITPTTPYLIQRIIGNVGGTQVRFGIEPTTNIPLLEIATETNSINDQSESSTLQSTMDQGITASTYTSITQPSTTRGRGNSRFKLPTAFDDSNNLIRTVTVTPSTISTPPPAVTTDFPIRTTFTPRRYTVTPTTINVPSKIASFTPTTKIPNVLTETEQNFAQLSTLGFQNDALEVSTVFPIYTSTTEETAAPQGITPKFSTDTTTNEAPPTFAATFRTRQRANIPTTTVANMEQLLLESYVRQEEFDNILASTTINPTTLQTTMKTINTKVKTLTEQQRKDLDELAKLEKEQQAILQQLAFLTRLNLAATPKPTRSPSVLAGRVLNFAAEQSTLGVTDSKQSENSKTQSADEFLQQLLSENNIKTTTRSSVQDILNQLNVNPNNIAASSLSSKYGDSTDAILAALLKEQGIEPSTPKSLGDQLKRTTPFVPTPTTRRTTTTKRRVTTTPRPGPIMQGLNWLLNALAPSPTTRKPPQRKLAGTTKKITTIPQDVELLSNQPTEITPVVVTAPSRIRSASSINRSRTKKPLHSLTEDELKNLIGQLEEAQKDPSKAKDIDFVSLGFIQSTTKSTTLVADNAVQITNSGRVGSSSKLQVTADSTGTEAEIIPVYNRRRSTTPISASVSNSIADEFSEETTTMRNRRLPPVQLNPVRGIDDEGETQVRGQLISAAVNVTRAISQFLGSAIQGAAQSIQSFIGSGSRQVGNYFAGSSLSANRPG